MLVSLVHNVPFESAMENAAQAPKNLRGEEMQGLAVAICKPGAVEAAIFDPLTLVKTNTNLGGRQCG